MVNNMITILESQVQNGSTTTEWRNCFLCGKKIEKHEQNQISTTLDETGFAKTAAKILSELLKIEQEEMIEHSKLLCLACYNTVLNLDNLRKHIQNIESEIIEKFRKTKEKLNSQSINDENIDNITSCPNEISIDLLESENEKSEDEVECIDVVNINSNVSNNTASNSEKDVVFYDVENSECYTFNTIIDEDLSDLLMLKNEKPSFVIFQDHHLKSFISINTLNSEFDEEIENVKELLYSESEALNIGHIDTREVLLQIGCNSDQSIPEKEQMINGELPESPVVVTTIDDDNYYCMLCAPSKAFPISDFLFFGNHLLNAHCRSICPFCFITFTKHKTLYAHMKQFHGWNDESSLKCEQCQRFFKHYIHFLRHVCSNKRNIVGLFICDICNYRTFNSRQHRTHIKTHLQDEGVSNKTKSHRS